MNTDGPLASGDYRYCHLRFFERVVLADDEEPSKFIQSWRGAVEWSDVENDSQTATLGSFALTFIDMLGSVRETVAARDVFDCTQSLWDLFATLFDTDAEELKPAVQDLVVEPGELLLTDGVLFIERVTILPAHRRHGVGLLAMKTLIEQFRAAAGMVAIKVFPLQFEGGARDEPGLIPASALGLHVFKGSPAASTARLRRHYARLGFVPVPRTDYMVLNPARQLPDVDDLIK